MKALPVELLAPGQGRDITVLVHCHIGDKMQLLAQGGTGVRIGTVIEQAGGQMPLWGIALLRQQAKPTFSGGVRRSSRFPALPAPD